jgi:glyoxalase family protein
MNQTRATLPQTDRYAPVSPEMAIIGLHHITLGSADAQRTTDFYTRVLGLRLIKKTVNFDDPTTYHLYFGNETADPGSAITYFEWPGAGRGVPGIGGTHHYALTVAGDDALRMWKRRLTDLGVRVDGPFNRNYFRSIYFHDPDGQVIEIATAGPGWTVDESADALGTAVQQPPTEMTVNERDAAAIDADTWPEPVSTITPQMALSRGMHHITAISSDIARTDAFYSGVLGLRRVKMTVNFDDPTSAHWYWGVGEGQPGTIITYFERDPAKTRRAQMGAGQTHHIAFAVPDEAAQHAWRQRLIGAGYRVSPIMDRMYFKSIYTNDPDGHIIELATLGPGFAADEPLDALGNRLTLPPWLEKDRDQIEHILRPITTAR